MKVLSVEQIRQADKYTIIREPISDEALMERAAGKCADFIIGKWSTSHEFYIFCGPGNNGGDGLVIARLLAQKQYTVFVFRLQSAKYSESYIINLKRLEKQDNVKNISINSIDELPQFCENSVIIDAIFGSGLTKQPESLVAKVISHINQSPSFVLSIDIPSGLCGDFDQFSNEQGIIKADLTLTFHSPKKSFFLQENYIYTGEWLVLDIGLDEAYIRETEAKIHYIQKEDVGSILKPRHKYSHKGSFGHALLVCGSYGKTGAAILASKACLRAGAGLLTVKIPRCGYTVLQTSVPEAMVLADEYEDRITSFNIKQHYSAIGIGPGIGTESETAGAFKFLIQNHQNPLVIDADALNILSENPTWLSFLPKNSILTPHSREFERLAGKSDDSMHRIEMQKAFSEKYRVFLIFKGANTCISTPDGELWFNSTGNPGMATAGCGDVLTGILTGLLAQGYSPFETCIAAVWLHGKAGDIASEHTGENALIAGDIIDYLGKAFMNIIDQ